MIDPYAVMCANCHAFPCEHIVAEVGRLVRELVAERARWSALKDELRHGIVTRTSNLLDGILQRMGELEEASPCVSPSRPKT